jgi:hypothetical protein
MLKVVKKYSTKKLNKYISIFLKVALAKKFLKHLVVNSFATGFGFRRAYSQQFQIQIYVSVVILSSVTYCKKFVWSAFILNVVQNLSSVMLEHRLCPPPPDWSAFTPESCAESVKCDAGAQAVSSSP